MPKNGYRILLCSISNVCKISNLEYLNFHFGFKLETYFNNNPKVSHIIGIFEKSANAKKKNNDDLSKIQYQTLRRIIIQLYPENNAIRLKHMVKDQVKHTSQLERIAQILDHVSYAIYDKKL